MAISMNSPRWLFYTNTNHNPYPGLILDNAKILQRLSVDGQTLSLGCHIHNSTDIHDANPTNPNRNNKVNPNPTNPTNPNTRYRCEYGTINLMFAPVDVRGRVRVRFRFMVRFRFKVRRRSRDAR